MCTTNSPQWWSPKHHAKQPSGAFTLASESQTCSNQSWCLEKDTGNIWLFAISGYCEEFVDNGKKSLFWSKQTKSCGNDYSEKRCKDFFLAPKQTANFISQQAFWSTPEGIRWASAWRMNQNTSLFQEKGRLLPRGCTATARWSGCFPCTEHR